MDFAVFIENFAAQHAAIEGDTEITDGHRAEFRLHIENCADVSILSDYVDDFCHLHQLIGRRVILSAGERLGRTHRRVDFTSWIANSLSLSIRDVEELLQDWLALEAPQQLAAIHASIGHLYMSPYIIWAFRNDTTALEPLNGLNINDLPCVLGLQYLPGTAFLFWEFELPAGVYPHRPTAFDAGMRYMPGWRSGGLTVPNPECRDRYAKGMPEVVHQRVHYRTVAGRVRWST